MDGKVKNIGFTFACIKIMNSKLCILFSLTILSATLSAQQLSQPDSSDVLQEVIIKGYEQNRRSIETGASVGTIKQQDLTRFSPGSLVPAINTIPGVRMEERSPASYRLSIRGSSLRSPFGVRNVKMYIDGIPFTDAGGNSYLNQLSPNLISSIEVQKGPGGSMYVPAPVAWFC
jgi:iron complex outermembrane receptor protein